MDLKKRIRECRRSAFDEVEDLRSEHMWNQIQRAMDGDPKKAAPPLSPSNTGKDDSGWKLSVGRYWRWSIAAAIALALGVFLFRPAASTAGGPSPQLSDYYPEFADEEQHYQRLIAQKEAALQLDRLDTRDYKTAFEELNTLDQIHRQYLKDLPRYYDNEQLVRTLIKYYEQKIRILERLSLEIEKKKHHEERNREIPL